MNPTTPRPDPVTEARERLERLLPDGIWTEPGFGAEWSARLDNLIALARAEAGVSAEALVEATQDVPDGRWRSSGVGSSEDWYCRGWQDRGTALAARSAGSGSRVEHTPLEDNPPVWCEEHHEWETRRTPLPAVGTMTDAEGAAFLAGIRPTPPPAVDGTRCGWRLKHGDRCDATRVAVWHEVPVAPYNDANHPFTPPAPDPDRLRALEAALWGVLRLGHIQDDGPSLCRCKVHVAARALLADGERSE